MTKHKDVDKQLSTAAALITKARVTPFPAERESLAMRAYAQLAGFLNSIDPTAGPNERRRERRLLVDRRGARSRPKDTQRAADPTSSRAASSYQAALARRPVVGRQIDVEA